MCGCMYVCVHVRACMFVWVCGCMYVCVLGRVTEARGFPESIAFRTARA